MKYLLLSLLLFSFSLNAQTFTSKSSSKQKTEFEAVVIDRTVAITDSQISVSNFIGSEPLILEILNSEEKEFRYEGVSIWYYCKSPPGTKYTAVLTNSEFPKSLILFQEVYGGASSIQTTIDFY